MIINDVLNKFPTDTMDDKIFTSSEKNIWLATIPPEVNYTPYSKRNT